MCCITLQKQKQNLYLYQKERKKQAFLLFSKHDVKKKCNKIMLWLLKEASISDELL